MIQIGHLAEPLCLFGIEIKIAICPWIRIRNSLDLFRLLIEDKFLARLLSFRNLLHPLLNIGLVSCRHELLPSNVGRQIHLSEAAPASAQDAPNVNEKASIERPVLQ